MKAAYKQGLVNEINHETAFIVHTKLYIGYFESSIFAFTLDTLMESVFRMTYKKLYFFKKTLKETGQLILAENVPVRLADGSELDLDDV